MGAFPREKALKTTMKYLSEQNKKCKTQIVVLVLEIGLKIKGINLNTKMGRQNQDIDILSYRNKGMINLVNVIKLQKMLLICPDDLCSLHQLPLLALVATFNTLSPSFFSLFTFLLETGSNMFSSVIFTNILFTGQVKSFLFVVFFLF